jgi:hypothetical protein
MNIIIVAKPFSTPRVVRFGSLRSYAVVAAAATTVLAVIAGMGILVGAKWVAPSQAQVELDEARARISAQHGELDEVRQAVARDIDAIAIRVGRLQAEASRLNALGDRLAKVGKLDDGEFDFTGEPALGGPAATTQASALSVGEVTSALDRLEQKFEQQSNQLGLLESVLFDREVDQSLMPAGMPVRVGYVSSGFGYRADPFTGRSDFHPGIDFNGEKGADILAVAGGVISYSGQRPGYGNVVEIDHGNGYMTRYAHNSANLSQVGDAVRAGDLIAKMGATGRATGTHVHLEVWLNGRLVNPSQYIHAIR